MSGKQFISGPEKCISQIECEFTSIMPANINIIADANISIQ